MTLCQNKALKLGIQRALAENAGPEMHELGLVQRAVLVLVEDLNE